MLNDFSSSVNADYLQFIALIFFIILVLLGCLYIILISLKKNANRDAFLNTTYKFANILAIVSWIIMIVCGMLSLLHIPAEVNMAGVMLIVISTLLSGAKIIIGIGMFRQGRVAHGVLLLIFGTFTLGIWPFVVAQNSMRTYNKTHSYPVSQSSSKPSSNNRIAILLIIIGYITLYFIVGFFLIIIGTILVVSNAIRVGHVQHGTWMIFLGMLTLGIWPLIYAFWLRPELVTIEAQSQDGIYEVY